LGRGKSPSFLFSPFDTTGVWFYNARVMKSGTKSTHKRLLISFTVIILCLVLVFPVFAGCGGASNTFIELMRLVPAGYTKIGDYYPLHFTLIDYASIYQADGIVFNTPDELLDSLKEGLNEDKISYSVLGWGSFITGYGRFANTSSIRKDYVGYDIACIDAEINFDYPPLYSVVAIGRFDPQTTEEALSHQGEWPSWAVDAYTTEEYHGVTIHSWGSGLEIHLETRLVPPHIDMLGRAMPLAVTYRYLFYTNPVEAIKLSIDTSQGQHPSLADLPEYAAIAKGLDELQAYAAMVCDGAVANRFLSELEDETFSLSETQKELIINTMDPPLKNLLTFGSGLGRDEKGTYLALVIYHENPDNALENVSLLKQRIEIATVSGLDEPWSSIITDTDIKAEGNVLLAKLYTPSMGFWSHFVYFYDNLLYHEE
jgi:hypothetical protein